MKSRQKNIVLGSVVILVLAGVLGRLQYQKYFSIQDVPPSQQQWSEPPGLFVVPHKEDKVDYFTFFRMSDGREDHVSGTWKYNFFYPTQLALFGSYPDKESQQNLYFMTDVGANIRNIAKLPGEVVSIEQNPEGTYLLIRGLKPQKVATEQPEFYSCIAEKLEAVIQTCRMVDTEIIPKKYFSKDMGYSIYWDKSEKRRLIIEELFNKQQMFTFDPWEKQAVLVTSADEAKTIRDKNKALEDKTPKEYTLDRNGYIATFTAKNGKKTRFLLAKNDPILWVSKKQFVFIHNKKVSVVDIEKRVRSELFTLPEHASSIESYYGKYTFIAPQL